MNTLVLDTQKIKKISLPGKISIVLFYSLVLMSFMPQLRALSFFNYLWLLNLIGWIFFSFLVRSSFFLKPNIHRLAAYVFFIYVFFISTASGNLFLVNRYLEYLQLMIFCWGFELYLVKYQDRRVNEKILLFLSPWVVFTSVHTIYAYSTMPFISRLAKKDTARGLELMSQGVAGYDFVYFLIFVFSGLIYLAFIFKRRFLIKTVLLFLAALFLVNIVLSNFMMAMLLSLLALFFRFFVYKISKVWIFIYTSLLVFLVPISPLMLNVIFDVLLEISRGSLNETRLLEIRSVLESGIIEASLGARLYAYNLSWQAFMEYPLTGIVINHIKNASGVVVGFGQHSFLLDSFALFGGVAWLLSLYVFLAPVVRLCRQARHVNYSSFPLLIIFMVLLLFSLNNVTPSIGFAVFFFIPVVVTYMKRSVVYGIK